MLSSLYFVPGKLLQSTKRKVQVQLTKNVEAGDPRYRLPLSQLDSPFERGQVRAGVYACTEYLAMIPAAPARVLYKKDLACDKRRLSQPPANCESTTKRL